MALPAAVATGLTLAPGIMQAITGLLQTIKGGKYANTQRPVKEIPPQILEALQSARTQATQRTVPGMEELQASQLGGALGTMKETASSPSQLLGAATQMYGSNVDATNKANIARYDQNQATLRDMLTLVGSEEQKAWEWNKAKPFMAAMETARALRDSGTKNIFEGAKTGVGTLLGQDQNAELMALLKKMMGGGAAGGGITLPSNLGQTDYQFDEENIG